MRDKRRFKSFGDVGEVADASPHLVELAVLDVGSTMHTMGRLREKEVQRRIFGPVQALDHSDGAPLHVFRH
jgi:hypothetical protein